jgi:probable rRNA maturation factor
MPLHIQIHVSDNRRPVDTSRMRKALKMIAIDYQWQNGEISVALVSDPEIHQLNKDHLQHDYATDVLSFDLTESDDFLEGEIIASIDTADREAPEHGWSGDDELLLYVIHGMLHVVGLLDKEPTDIALMRSEERHYLEKVR